MKRLVFAGIVLALVCAAGGSASTANLKQILNGPKARAAHEAQRLLDAYVPRDAVRLQSAPKGDHLPLRIPGRLFGKVVDRHRFWLVHVPVSAIAASFQGRLNGWGSAAIVSKQGRHGPASAEATYTAPGFGGRATGRLLNLTAVKAHGGGSLLRADVVVVWHLSPAEGEDLPAGIREIDIQGPPRVKASVTDKSQIRTIVRWFDHLALYEPQFVALGCPYMGAPIPTFTFDFRGRHGRVAHASIPALSGVCSGAQYTLRGHEQTPLVAGDFDYRVQGLLQENWIGPPDMLGLANQRQGEAMHKAAELMQTFQPPPHATRIDRPKYYGGALNSVGVPFGEFAQLTRYWHVDTNTSSVVAFLQAHDVPAGFKGSCGSNRHFGSSQCDLNALPAGSRYFEFTVQRTRGGTSILRVDAQVVWVYPRSPTESVRAGRVSEIDFSAPGVSRRITDLDVIARVVRWFNRIPIVPPGMGGSPGCGLSSTAPVTLDFLRVDGKRLAQVEADVTEPDGGSNFCNPMAVTIAGAAQPSLISLNFFGRVQREIGVTVKAPGR